MRFNFPEVMKKLSIDELKEYLHNQSIYEPEAIQAAFNELRSRGEIIPDELAIIKKPVAQVKKSDDNHIVYAGFGSRFGANLIDGLIMLPLSLGMVVLMFVVGFWVVYPYQIIVSLISSAYIISFLAIYGATWGKMACKIEVRRVDLTPIGWIEAIKRHSVELITSLIIAALNMIALMSYSFKEIKSSSPIEVNQLIAARRSDFYGVVFFISILWSIGELITLLFNEKRRALHDLLGGTVVVKKESLNNLLLPVVEKEQITPVSNFNIENSVFQCSDCKHPVVEGSKSCSNCGAIFDE